MEATLKELAVKLINTPVEEIIGQPIFWVVGAFIVIAIILR